MKISQDIMKYKYSFLKKNSQAEKNEQKISEPSNSPVKTCHFHQVEVKILWLKALEVDSNVRYYM